VSSGGASVILKAGMAAPDPAPLPDYGDDGVDLSLIRWMLSLTPAERLQFHEQHLNDILAIRELNGGA
jgi:hypothetical protein